MKNSLCFVIITLLFVCRTEEIQKFSVDVYVESICEDCHRFIANEIKYIAMHPEFQKYVDINLFIFGKARVMDEERDITLCQFGAEGCLGNKALNCIYRHSPSFVDSINLIQCMYEIRTINEVSIQTCYDKFGLDSHDALMCFTSEEAKRLMFEAAANTPPLQWVPAFRDGDTIRKDTRNLVQYICQRIPDTIEACSSGKHTVGMDSDL